MSAHTHREGTTGRRAGGVEATLLWAKSLNRVWVAVRNHRWGEEFELQSQADDNLLDVFHRPYPYAAARMPELLAAA